MSFARVLRARSGSPVLVAVAALLLGAGGCDSRGSPPLPELTAEDEVTLREGISTRSELEFVYPPPDGPRMLQPALHVSGRIKDMHGRNRVGTLRVLLDIVSNGPARDVVFAEACAEALEGDEVVAGMLVEHSSVDTVDEKDERGRSRRDSSIEHLERLLWDAVRHESGQ